jgi:hypothetical protein
VLYALQLFIPNQVPVPAFLCQTACNLIVVPFGIEFITDLTAFTSGFNDLCLSSCQACIFVLISVAWMVFASLLVAVVINDTEIRPKTMTQANIAVLTGNKTSQWQAVRIVIGTALLQQSDPEATHTVVVLVLEVAVKLQGVQSRGHQLAILHWLLLFQFHGLPAL